MESRHPVSTPIEELKASLRKSASLLPDQRSMDALARLHAVEHLERELAAARADTARIECLARHPLKAAIKGGPDDGDEAKVWAISSNPKWNLRQAIDSLRLKDGEKL
jgi:isochorismate synthase EntC